jgi:hypothetical protein
VEEEGEKRRKKKKEGGAGWDWKKNGLREELE